MPQVTTGTVKGVELEYPDTRDYKRSKTRIVSNRCKQGIFDTLQNAVIDADILDLYCGIGSLGIEALSRGATFCDFVDASKTAAKFVKKNLELTEFNDQGEVFNRRVEDFLIEEGTFQTYRIILMDPPYSVLTEQKAIDLLGRASDLLVDKGIIVYKHSYKRETPEVVETSNGKLIRDKHKDYGNTVVSFYFFETSKE
jgi:16S rRNA (guanine(966)-N(2))-methyltransferase RsmD